jgi:hypothetical protein
MKALYAMHPKAGILYHSDDKPGTCSSSNKAESPIPETEKQTHHHDHRDQASYGYIIFQAPIAQSTGRSCKLCTKGQRNCRYHSDYKKQNFIPKLDCSVRAGINISSSGKSGISSSAKAGIISKGFAGISSRFQVPIAKTTGMPCKLCTKSQTYCRFYVGNFLRL